MKSIKSWVLGVGCYGVPVLRCWVLGVGALAISGHAQNLQTPNSKLQTVITIKPLSEVTNDRITLGEVAIIEGDKASVERLKQVFLGETPILGLRRLITRQSLNTRLLAAGEKPDKLTILVPDDARVVRKGQTIAGEQLVEAAKTYIRQQLGFEVELSEKEVIREIAAPVGELNIVPISYSESIPTLGVTLAIRVDGKLFITRTIKLYADASQGVKQGQEVKIRIRSAGAFVELTGKAKSSAILGQTVQVTTDRKTTHTGKVVAAGVVEVSL